MSEVFIITAPRACRAAVFNKLNSSGWARWKHSGTLWLTAADAPDTGDLGMHGSSSSTVLPLALLMIQQNHRQPTVQPR